MIILRSEICKTWSLRNICTLPYQRDHILYSLLIWSITRWWLVVCCFCTAECTGVYSLLSCTVIIYKELFTTISPCPPASSSWGAPCSSSLAWPPSVQAGCSSMGQQDLAQGWTITTGPTSATSSPSQRTGRSSGRLMFLQLLLLSWWWSGLTMWG